jgi:hypothetical protein
MKTMKKMFDVVSYTPYITWEGHKRYTTVRGLIISLIAFCLVSVLSIFSLIYLQKETLDVLLTKDINDLPEYNFTNFPFMFKINDNYGQTINNADKIYHFYFTLWTFSPGINSDKKLVT